MLGNDVHHLPCEGGTVTAPRECGNRGGAILEGGMDNSPMYYNAFNNSPASYDAAAGRLQLYEVQMSALFVSESLALQQLATIAEQPAAVPAELRVQSTTMSALVNGSLWDEATGIYRQRDASPQARGLSAVRTSHSHYNSAPPFSTMAPNIAI